MKKIWVILLMGFFLVSFASAMTLCQEQTDIDNIPCLGLTKSLTCSGPVNVTNLNDSTTTSLNTTLVGVGIYNFTFNFNQSSYSLIACDGSTSTIVVGNFNGLATMTWIFIIGVVGALALFFLGYRSEQPLYSFSSGALFIISGILVLINLVTQFNALGDLIKIGIGTVCIGIGGYIIISDLFINRGGGD